MPSRVQSGNTAPFQPKPGSGTLCEVTTQQRHGLLPGAHWFSGTGRALFAQEVDGRWCHIEYLFAVESRFYELRWVEGKPARLWSMDRAKVSPVQHKAWHMLSHRDEIEFPLEEIEYMKTVTQNVPHALWQKLIQLALDAGQIS